MTKIRKHDIVKQYILKQIDSGFYRVGQNIESESDLTKKLEVSRMTVRKAIDDLVFDNILFRMHGKGTYVCERSKYTEFQCGIGFTEEVLKRNMKPSAKDITVSKVKADEEIAHDLQIAIDDDVWKVIRTRCADDVPLAYETEYYSAALVETLDEDIAASSIYKYLEVHQDLEFTYADQKIDAVIANHKLAEILGIQEGAPLIRMYIVAYLKNGTPFNCGTTYYRVDNFKLIQTIYKK